ncbi:hypothetical protein [Streptomyces cyaneofuscatus]
MTTNSGEEDVLGRLRNLKTHINDRRPSRHKPITLLWAIGRLAAEQERTGDHLVEWRTFREEVGPLLRDFGLPNSRVTPQYPFWHLRSSGLWDVEGIDTHEGTPTPSQLAAAGARAGFGKDAAKALRRSLARAEAIGLICSRHLPDVDRAALLERVGLAGYASASGELPDREGSVPRRRHTSFRPDGPHLGPDQLSNPAVPVPQPSHRVRQVRHLHRGGLDGAEEFDGGRGVRAQAPCRPRHRAGPHPLSPGVVRPPLTAVAASGYAKTPLPA